MVQACAALHESPESIDGMRIFTQLGLDPSAESQNFRRAPVERWQPEQCGVMDLRIDRNGVWWHEGQPIRRAGLIRVLASVLTSDGEDWWLKTPVEQVLITVEDAPFVVVDIVQQEHHLQLTTNVGEVVMLCEPWQLKLDPDAEWRPWIQLHQSVGARLSRPLLLNLIDQALVQGPEPSGDTLFWQACGVSWPLGRFS